MLRRTGHHHKGKVAPFPRRKQKSFGVSKLITVAGMFIFCFLLTVVIVQMFQHNRLRKELAAVELQVMEQESRNKAIAEEITRLNETGYIEMLARKLLGLVRPGEIVFQFKD